MKQSTFSAVMANSIKNLLQRYTKGIRFTAILTILFTIGVGQMWGATETYEKVTSAPSDWSGEYLIVYETGKVAFNGSLTTLDAASNTTAVTISNNKISLDSKYSFTIAKSGSNYTIKSASGKYIGNGSNSNALTSSTTALNNTISFTSKDDITIKSSGGAYLRYNATSGQTRFRYYKSSTYTDQKAIQLYKKVAATPTLTVSKTSLSISTKVGTQKTGTFTFSGSNLTSNATLTISGTHAGYFKVNPTTKTPSSGSIATTTATVTYSPEEYGTHTATLTVKSGTASKTVALNGTATCSYNINYTTNNEPDGDADAIWSKDNCFEQVGSTTEWRYEMTLPGGGGSFWVGNGAWVDNKSEVHSLSSITFVGLQGTSCGSKPYPGEGAVGYVRIYSDSGSKNYYAAFQPTYQIAFGIEGQTWTHKPFTLVSGNKYETDLVEIPSNFSSSYNYYVGPKTSDNGTYFVNDKSSTLAMNTMGGMTDVNAVKGSKGVFRIYDNSCDNNWYCSFIPYYNYKLLNDDGSVFYTSDYVSSEAANKTTTIYSTKPTKTGYTFVGWSRTQNATTAEVTAGASYTYWKANDTFYPVWKANYTVTFNLQGHGTAIAQQTVVAGNKATRPADPSETGYTFGGWFKESACTNVFDFNTVINANTTIYAKWTAKKYTYTLYPNTPAGATVIFKDNEGNSVDEIQITQTYGETAQSFANFYSEISCEGYRLDGWYSATSGGSQWTQTQSKPADNGVFNFYARWIKVHTITWKVNGQQYGEKQEVVDGQTIGTLPSEPDAPSSCSGKEFMGWTESATVDSDGTGITYISASTKPNSDKTYHAVFATKEGGSTSVVTDKLTRATTGISDGAGYGTWSGKKATSSAVYAGQSAGGNNAIQIRTTNSNSGIITTTSGGKITKVSVVWNSNTSSGRTLNVYGNNSAYSAATDLYDTSKDGDILGTIVYGTSTELEIEGDYEYIGLRSAGNAMYLTSVSITWSAGSEPTYTEYVTSCTPQHTITLELDGGVFDETPDGWIKEDENTYTQVVNENTTITLPTPTKKGYTYKGWRKTSLDNPVTSITATETATYTAVYDCALNTVGISGTYALTVGDVFELVATAYDSNGDVLTCPANTTYSWVRYNSVNDKWEAITDDNSDGDDAKLTFNNCQIANCGTYRCHITYGDCGAWSLGYDVHCFHLKGDFEGDWNIEYAFNHTDEPGIATLTLDLISGHTHNFKIYDGISQYGNGGTISASITGWEYGSDNNSNTILKTGADGSYVFTLNYTQLINNSTNILVLDVTYPPSNQSEGYTVYYDNLVHNWQDVYYRIGHNRDNGNGTWGWNQNKKMTKVPGTSHLYTTKTPPFDNFEAWHIANNVAWSGERSIYNVNTNDEYAITHATEYKKFVVVEDITLTPDADGTFVNGENCTYYPAAKQAGMKKHNAKIIASPTGGTITVSYTDHDGTAKSDFTSGDRDLAHTCLLTITATPDAGYSLGTLTVNDVPFTSGKVHTLAEDAVIKVVWTEKTTPTFAWSAPSYTAALEADNTFPTLNNPNSLSPITYTSSNTSVATIDANGNITLVATGTTTIAATGAETATHKSATDTYELIVVAANCKWVEVEIEDIKPDDEVLVTMGDDKIVYALGTEKIANSPKAKEFNVIGNYLEDSNYSNYSGYSWYIIKTNDGYQLQSYTDNSKFLYGVSSYITISDSPTTFSIFKSTENGNECFSYIASSVYYLMYGVENSQPAWKRVTTTNHLTSQTLKFYKRECLDSEHYWVEGNLTNVTCAPQLPQQLAKDESITLTFTAADGYALPTSVNVEMGATTLSTTSWDRGTGKLTINAPAGGFTDNVLVTVEALQVKTVTFSVGNGDTAPGEIQAEENTNITLPSHTTNLTCVKFVGWTDAVNDAAITSSNLYEAGDSYKVTQDITLKAVYAAGGGFVLVTDANDLAADDRIVIAAAGFDVAMGIDRGNNRGEVEVTKDNTDNTITTPDDIQILILEAGTTAGTLAFNTGNGYLYAAGGTSSNYLKTTQNLDNRGSWNISISAEGIATIKSVEPTGDKARNWLRYNSTNTPPIFSCYASGQADVSIYKESVTGYTINPECEEYDITLEVIGHANGSARINGQTAAPNTSQTVTILNTEKATISDVANVAGYDVTVNKRSGNATFTDNGNGTWTVSEPASNVTIQVQYTAKQTYKVQFVTGTGGVGSFTSLDAYKGQTVTIPANYEAVGLCGEFVGWTEGARASGEKPTKLYQPGDPFTLNSNGTSLYAVYSISASCTSEFALGKSGDYEMYAIYSNNVYYVTQKNGSNDYFYANTEADIEANARVKSTFRMQYDATQTAAWNEQDVYAYTIYISNGSTEYGFWHLNSVGDLDFDATEPYYWKVKSYNGGYDIYGEANGRTYRITCNGSNFNARTSADAVYLTPGGGIEYWTDIDCSDINVDVIFAWNKIESWPVGMPNANSYKGLAKCSEITEFPVALQEGWTFLGWSTKEYNALHADDLDNENNASRAYPDGSDIYKTGGNTLKLGSADITLYPVFTRYEENEPLNLVNGGEFYMYVKPGNTDVYGGLRRFYIADVNLSSGGFTSTEDCNDARPFTFIKEDAGWLIQFVDEGGKTYYLGANAEAGDLTKHQTNKTYWDITVGAGNNPANAYRMMAIGQGSEDALFARFANGLTSATFKYYAIENLINTPSAYFDIFLGSCEDRVFSSDPTSKPSVTITGGGYVTGSKGQTVFVPSAFTITGKNLNDNYNVNIADVGGLLKFYNEAGNVISGFGKPLGGKLAQTTFYVAYTPTADTDGTEIPSIIVTNGTGGSALNQEITDLIHARHLPAEFAIVAKIGGNWYALPDTALHVQTPEGLLVEVDNVDSPTAVTQSFCNATAWSLRGVKSTRYVVNSVLNGDNVLFAETNTEVIDNRKMLYAGEDSKVGAYATYTNYTATNPDRYEWQLTTTDNITYTVNSNSTIVSDPLSVNNSRAFGTHGKFVASEEIRLLPIEGPCIAPAVFQVIEWKTNGMKIMYTGAGVSATTQVGTYAASDAKMTEVDHGVYELTTSQDLTACTGLKLAITFTDASSNKTQKVLVIPAIVSGEKGSTSLVASNAVAKVTDVVVLDDAKLTADGTQYTYNDVVVYPGGKLVIDDGKALGMYSLTLRAGSSWGAEKYENKYPQFLLKGVYSNSSGQINLDYVTTQDYYYPLSVPEQVTIADIKYPVDIYGSNVKANNTGSFQLKYYDGAQRVKQGSQYGTGWVVVDEDETKTLTPNQGYAIWGIPKKINGTRQTYGIHRIPIKKAAGDLVTNEKTNAEIPIKAHGINDANVLPNDKGWNYLGNPYLAGLGGMDGTDRDLQMGLLVQEVVNGQWTGGWVNNGAQVRYVTLTNDCQTFEAKPVAEAQIPAFTTFFIQAAQDGAIALTAPTNAVPASIAARQYAAQQEAAKEITTGILLTGNDQTDRTGLLIADNFTEEYEFNADLSKFENSGINLYTIGKTGKLAYMAINQTLAEQPIPVGYSAPAEGLYTIAFDEDRYNATDISALYLIDYDSNEKTNLLHTDYSFVTAAGTNNQRFALQVAFAPANATNIEWVGDGSVQVGVEGNTLMLNNLPTDAAVHVFDALGRLMYHAPTVPTEMQLTLPTGYYLVRIADKQNAVVIKTVIP